MIALVVPTSAALGNTITIPTNSLPKMLELSLVGQSIGVPPKADLVTLHIYGVLPWLPLMESEKMTSFTQHPIESTTPPFYQCMKTIPLQTKSYKLQGQVWDH